MDKIESMRLIFSEGDLQRMLAVKDVFNKGTLQSGKRSYRRQRHAGIGIWYGRLRPIAADARLGAVRALTQFRSA